jgi:hypothetical protein
VAFGSFLGDADGLLLPVALGSFVGFGVAVIVRGTGDLSSNCTSTGSAPNDAATTW